MLADFVYSGADGFSSTRFTTSTGGGGAPTFTTSGSSLSVATGATGAFTDTACVNVKTIPRYSSWCQFDWTVDAARTDGRMRVGLRAAGTFDNVSTEQNIYDFTVLQASPAVAIEQWLAGVETDLISDGGTLFTFTASHEYRFQGFVKRAAPTLLGVRLWDLTAGNGPNTWLTASADNPTLNVAGSWNIAFQNGSGGTAWTNLLRNLKFGPMTDSATDLIINRRV